MSSAASGPETAATRGGARQERIRAWKARLAESAARLFLERGFDNVTVDEVCADAGVSHATFYRYFAAKEDALFAYEDEFVAAIRDAAEKHDDLRKTVLAFADYLTARTEHVGRADAVVMATPSLLGRTLVVQRRWRDALAGALAAKAERAEPALEDVVAAGVALAALSAAVRSWRDGSGRSLHALIEQALDLAHVP